jgi:hypothetical protein
MYLLKVKKTVVLGICVSFVLLALSACSKKIAFATSSVAPAARGYVKIKKDKNENYALDISISNLAEVERLQGNNKTYVVWMTSNNETAKNIGQISSSTKRFSKKLGASFHTVSTSKPTKVFITAEGDGTVLYPGSTIVLSTEEL